VEHCRHCQIAIWSTHDAEHPGLCCDCFDLSFGMPLARLDAERAAAGRPPIGKPWPTRTVLVDEVERAEAGED
jgi:hypothetical protein